VPDQAQSLDSLIGLEFGHYCILEQLGSGGMGVVYLARDSHLDRDVAIKVLHPGTITDESARKRFHNEARALSSLNHPNIATIHDFDNHLGTDFLVMEYIPGVSLNEKLAVGPLSEREVLHLGIQLADGLAAAHESAVIHRDLKPSNLRITSDSRLKILDFGLAKFRQSQAETAVTQSQLESHSFSGTFPYMAPEQLLGGEIDSRTDIYAAGLIFYEMATGQRPYLELPSGQLLGAILHRAPIPPRQLNPSISHDLEHLISKCLEKDPADRFQSARELDVDLRRLSRDSSSGTIPDALPRPPALRFLRNHKALTLTVSALFFVSALTALFLLLKARNLLPVLSTGSAQIQSIAVLPLVNLSGDPEREYFADGLTEELITQIGKTTALRVISRQSVMQFKHTEVPLSGIARKLDVDAIVEGSVLQSGNRLRVTARLVRASAEKPIWTEQYDRDLRDVLALQAELTQAIISEIKVKISPQDQARLASPRAVSPEAYEAYLKGRFEWYKISKSGFEAAERYFQLALDKDPNYALAYAGLADVWLMRSDSGYAPSSTTYPQAKASALKAIALDPSLAEPHVSLANIESGYEHDWPAAEQDFKRAIQLNANSADAHFMYADLLISLKRYPEWQVEIQRALSLDPINYFTRCFYGWQLIYLGRYDEAIATLQTVAATQPNFSSVHMGLWGAYYKKRMDKEAYEEAVRFFEILSDHEVVEALKSGYHEAGYRLAMKRGADVLAARSEHSHVSGIRIARLYSHAGENERALLWLEKAFDADESPVVHLSVGWDWDNLRPAPRFQDLLRRLHLPE